MLFSQRTVVFLLLICLAAPMALAQFNDHPRIWLTPERIERIHAQHYLPDSHEWHQLMIAADRDDMDGVKAQALAYVVTGEESWAQTAVGHLQQIMIDEPVMTVAFNSVGRKFNSMALAFDWLYHSPHFTPALKQQLIDYVSAVPENGSGKWNWYPDGTYFNGVSKVIWGPPLWGLATHGDNPLADVYIDNGYENRWLYIRNSLGYGPANLAVVRGGCMPQGMDYASGTMTNILRYLDAVWTATGQDYYEEAPALRAFLEYFVKSYYYTEDFIRRPEHGHNAHKSGGYLPSSLAGVLIAMNRYRDEEEGRWAAWWVNDIEGAQNLPGSDYRNYSVIDVIFSDSSIPQEPPFGQPLGYFAEGNGMWIVRSDWSGGAVEPMTYGTFRAGNWTWFNQNHWDQGNYCIYSHGADLLIDGGEYEGGGGLVVINYHHQTIAHNSITVTDPLQTKGWHFYNWESEDFENSGGQNMPYRETIADAVLDGEPKNPSFPRYQGTYLHDMSDVTYRSHNDRYTWAFADLTNAYANPRWEEDYDASRLAKVDYRPKVTNVTRHWIYLRPQPGHEGEYFLTFDRVSSTDASFAKKTHLHFLGEPVMTAGQLVDTEVPGHIETWSADRFTMETGGAALHGAILLPRDAQLRKIGGVGYEYWVNGTNYDPFPNDENPWVGSWRMEIAPTEERIDDLFLTVLSPDWAGTEAPEMAGIPSANMEGVATDGWVLMFAAQEARQAEAGYFVAMSGPQQHLLFDMEPNYSYSVYRNGDPAPIALVTSGANGLVEFSSPDGGSFQVTQGELIADDTPPSGSIQIQGGECSGSALVMLALSATDDESGMSGGQMRLSNDGLTWSDPIAYQENWLWELEGGEGERSVHVVYADLMGNWMIDPASDTVNLDEEPPAATFAIAEETVPSSTVTLHCAAEDTGCGGGTLLMSFSNDAVNWSPVQPLDQPVSWSLAGEAEGSYTVYARFGDGAGNWTDPPLSDTVELVIADEDQTPPRIDNFFPPADAVEVPTNTSVSAMLMDLQSGIDTSSVRVLINGDEKPRSFFEFSGNRYLVVGHPGVIFADGALCSVELQASDLADPSQQTTVAWTFTTAAEGGGQESQPPSPPTGLKTSIDSDCNITLTWDTSSDPDVIGYQVSWGMWPDGEAVILPIQEQAGIYIEDLPDGSYWLSVASVDASGNISPVSYRAEAVVLACGEEEQEDPGEETTEPQRGEIWPPGILLEDRSAPLTVSNLDAGWTVRIFTVSGRPVATHRAVASGEEFIWDRCNYRGSTVVPGLYLVRVFDAGGRPVSDGRYLLR